jgi:ABC-type glycerol-3-phosphate transport system substrate-binding protein
MKAILKLVLLMTIFSLLLAACGGEATPLLAATDQTTLVFIYTDG